MCEYRWESVSRLSIEGTEVTKKKKKKKRLGQKEEEKLSVCVRSPKRTIAPQCALRERGPRTARRLGPQDTRVPASVREGKEGGKGHEGEKEESTDKLRYCKWWMVGSKKEFKMCFIFLFLFCRQSM
jgi:hypothetical protein